MQFSPDSDQPPKESPKEPPKESRPDGQPAIPELRILLIEDSEHIRLRLTQILDEPGTMRVVAFATTVAEAGLRIEDDEYDVLLVDIELGSGSGISAIRQARATYPVDRQPLIIVLTNYALPAVRTRCMDAGADHFLDKMRQFQEVKPLIIESRLHGA